MPKDTYKVETITNWVGGMRIGVSPMLLEDTQFPDCSNVEIWPEGMVRKRKGSSIRNPDFPATGGDNLSGGAWFNFLYQFWLVSGTTYLVAGVVDADSVSGSDGADIVYFADNLTEYYSILGDPVSGFTLTPTSQVFGDQLNDELILVNGLEQPIYWGGNTAVPFETILAAPIAQYIKHFKDFIFLGNVVNHAGTTLDSRIVWCYPDDAHTWPANNFLDLDADDGDEITGMEILGDSLIVFKERKIFEVRYISEETDFEYETKIDGRGCVAGASLTSIFNDLVFLAEDGIYAFDGYNIEDLGWNIKELILDIHPGYRAQVTSAPLEEKDQLWFAAPHAVQPDLVPGTSSSPDDLSMACNNMILVYNYDKENWVKIGGFSADGQEDFSFYTVTLGFYYNYSDLTFGDMTEAWSTYDLRFGDRMLLSATSILIRSDYLGYLYQQDYTDADGTEDFIGYFRTRWYDHGMPHITKKIYRFTVLLERNDDISVMFKVRTDWKESSTPVLDTTIDQSGTGEHYLDQEVVRKVVDTIITCQSYQFEFRTEGKDQSWGINSVIVEWREVGRTPIT